MKWYIQCSLLMFWLLSLARAHTHTQPLSHIYVFVQCRITTLRHSTHCYSFLCVIVCLCSYSQCTAQALTCCCSLKTWAWRCLPALPLRWMLNIKQDSTRVSFWARAPFSVYLNIKRLRYKKLFTQLSEIIIIKKSCIDHLLETTKRRFNVLK